MIILDPHRDGCTVWLVNSPIIGYENKVTNIKGDVVEVCKSLMNRLAGYIEVKNQWGNYVKKLAWADDVYLDVAGFGRDYKYIFNDYGLDIIEIRAKSAGSIIPETNMVTNRIDEYEKGFWAIHGRIHDNTIPFEYK